MSTRPPIPGDAGRLYFWIRKLDLRARDFSRIWMILQCC
jgi:uncharacterized protein YwqG